MIINNDKILKAKKSKRTNILSIYYPPPFVTYPQLALHSSSLLANNGYQQFYSLFIQISFISVSRKRKFEVYPHEEMIPNTNFFKSFTSSALMFNTNINKIVDFFKEWINNGYYITAVINSGVLEKTQFGKINTFHSTTIFGYDSDYFYLLDYDKNGVYSILEIQYNKIIDSCFKKMKNARNNTKWMNKENYIDHPLFRILKPIIFNDNILFRNSISSQISNYLQSKEENIFIYKNYFENVYFGISAYEEILKYISGIKPRDLIDIRIFTGLFEHKSIWVARLKYLEDNGYIKPSNYWNKFQDIEKKANDLKLLCIKYNYSREISILSKMKNLIINIKELEIPILEILLSELLKKS